MTTSNSYSFTVTRDDIVRLVMLTLQKIDETETPTPQETTDISLFLNMLVKQWMGKSGFATGLKTFTRRHGRMMMDGRTGQYSLGPTATGWTNNLIRTVTTALVSSGNTVLVSSSTGMSLGDNFGVDLDAGYIYWTTIQNIVGNTITITGTIPSQASSGATIYDYTTTAQQPQVIETVSLRDNRGNDIPLKKLTLEEYDSLPNKQAPTNISDPTAFYYEFQLGYGTLFLDVAGCSDLTKYLYISYMEATQDMVSALNNPSYPAEWFLPLALGTAKLCAPMFDTPWTATMESNYSTALAVAQDKEPEITTQYFQPGE